MVRSRRGIAALAIALLIPGAAACDASVEGTDDGVKGEIDLNEDGGDSGNENE